MTQKVARLDVRLDPDIKELAARASALVGSNNLSDFVVQAIREKASRAIEEADVVRLNTAAFDAFKATCESEAPENKALQDALRRRNVRKRNSVTNRRAKQKPAQPQNV